MSDIQSPDADPNAGDSGFGTVDLTRTPLTSNPFAPDPTDPTLDGGQALYHMAFGAQPEDFHPALQPLAQGHSLLFQPQPPKAPGLLGSLENIRSAIAASPDDREPSEQDAKMDAQDGNATPAGAFRQPNLPTAYPKTLDPTVERHVAEYNQAHGLKPGDREYLDPNLVKAMIRQEAGYNLDALIRDPMQVNAFIGDWDKQKAGFGLVEGVAPGADLSVKAGIQWLRRKAYLHDDHGDERRFIGWPKAVQRYNGHLADYSDQVWDHLGEIKGGF
jgi:hypothetical protein